MEATALVHEACFRLSRSRVDWASRDHFLAVAAKAMRHVPIDHARKRRPARELERGHSAALDVAAFESAFTHYEERAINLVALDSALTQLAKKDPQAAQLVELRFFAGQSVEDCARVLETTVRTTYRMLKLAKAFLHAAIDGDFHGDSA